TDDTQTERARPYRRDRATGERDDPAPEEHDVAGVVDAPVLAVAGLTEVPVDRLQHERPAPPGRSGGVRRGQPGVIPVHLLGELDDVPAVRDGRPPVPREIAAEIDRRWDDRERCEKQRGIPTAAGEQIERSPG